MARMLNWWGDGVIGGMFPLIIADIPLNLKPEDAAYFRKSREARFGKPLEEIMAGRDKAVEGFRKSLDPLRLTLQDAALPRRHCCELCGLHRVRRVPVGAGGQPVQAADGRRSGLCLARAAVRRVRRAGAEVAGLSRLASTERAGRHPRGMADIRLMAPDKSSYREAVNWFYPENDVSCEVK